MPGSMSCGFVTLFCFLVFAISGLAYNGPYNWVEDVGAACPTACKCFRDTGNAAQYQMDCNRRELYSPPLDTPSKATYLNFEVNNFPMLTRDYLKKLPKLEHLKLGWNSIDRINTDNFKDMKELEDLDLAGNKMMFLKNGMFTGLVKLQNLALHENRIFAIENGTFQGLPNLKYLWLFHNKISDITSGMLDNLPNLKVLALSSNRLTSLNQSDFTGIPNVEFIFAQHNHINGIGDNTFRNNQKLRHIWLNNNSVPNITIATFKHASGLEFITLSNNPMADIKDGALAYRSHSKLNTIYLLDTNLVRIRVNSFTEHRNLNIVIQPTLKVYPLDTKNDTYLTYGLSRYGFICNTSSTCYPCSMGSYSQRFPNGTYACVTCPAGGFYQNTIGQYGPIKGGIGCEECPHGTLVKLHNAPGLSFVTCDVCPAGTKTDQWADFRGCYCIDGFYRMGRFRDCFNGKGERGIKFNETALLHEGYWWTFEDGNSSFLYGHFLKNLFIPGPDYDIRYINYDGKRPKPYPCPRAASCLGGINSVDKPCETGYGGPLCEVCEPGFHRTLNRCQECPTVAWICVQLGVVGVVVLFIIIVLAKDNRKKAEEAKVKRRSLADVVLARLKIVIGFYQVTAGTLDAFNYVRWPDSLIQISSYAKYMQLNLVQIAPIQCFTQRLHMNAYSGFVATVGLNVSVSLTSFIYFQIRRIWIKTRRHLSAEEKAEEIFYCKARCYRTAFLIMFVSFPDTSSRILRMLPPACQKLCSDMEEKMCTEYLKMDYSLQCFDATYNKYVVFSYIGILYPLLFPTVFVLILYYLLHRPRMEGKSEDIKKYEVVEGMRFVYENYTKDCWYWEIVEICRKIVLTSGLALIGPEGRTYLGLSAMASGMYAVGHAHSRPMPDYFEHMLQLCAVCATFFNLSVGVLLRIPAETTNYSINNDKDAAGVTFSLLLVNVGVVVMLVMRYVYSVVVSLWWVSKNPQCNLQCCLGVFILPGELGDREKPADDETADQDPKAGNIEEIEMSSIDIGYDNPVTAEDIAAIGSLKGSRRARSARGPQSMTMRKASSNIYDNPDNNIYEEIGEVGPGSSSSRSSPGAEKRSLGSPGVVASKNPQMSPESGRSSIDGPNTSTSASPDPVRGQNDYDVSESSATDVPKVDFSKAHPEISEAHDNLGTEEDEEEEYQNASL